MITSSDFRVFFKNGYSTKGVNRGIGLAKLKNMVEQNGGDVHISSEELGHESMINIEVTINVWYNIPPNNYATFGGIDGYSSGKSGSPKKTMLIPLHEI